MLNEREGDMYRTLYQEGGSRLTKDGGIKVMQGRCLGGGTTVNWAACLPPRVETLEHWQKSFGLPFTRENLRPYLKEVANYLPIVRNDKYNTSAQKFLDGCHALGIETDNLPNNTHDCRECGSCGVGCPYDRKMSGFVRWLPDAVAKGATVLTGGRPRPDLGPYFHEPTLLSDVSDDMELFADETFGPVAAISRFSSDEEAIRRANDSRFGLNFSVWTRDTARGRRMATQLQAGTVNVNDAYIPTWGSIDAPMGGMKDSGLGRRHGSIGIKKYTEEQTVSVQRVMPLAPPPLVGQRLWSKGITAGLRLLRRIPGWR
jgi:hypothetical protein